MTLENNYGLVKNFLDANKKDYSSGLCADNFFIEYYIDNKLKLKGEEKIIFNTNHPEYSDDISISSLDSDIYHTGFRAQFLKYKYDKDKNILEIISDNKTPKHGPYKVLIYGDYKK
ncbi:hypothetical protein AFAEC_0582 [Aliarcobacter faecis]|uniref:hypothetical protein n=1 Tax=Aliarcobacter faecis TaxID=1564138 RepID=UPI00047C3347|nr:hypothetical protein [Aliarcobacter faecis]QKF72773.1 hypothetical protein AFAEC_0582 [Aliarcobacter faecis]